MDPSSPQSPINVLSPQDTHSEKDLVAPKLRDGSDRPTLSKRTNSEYVEMLLHQDKIPRTYNIFAGFFTWILLAGFVLFPGTFSSLKNDSVPKLAGVAGEVEKNILGVIQNLPLFVVAFVCCGIGAVGMIYLWWRWSNNYVWLVNRIFIPGTLNSLAGVISTLVNVYGAEHGEFSTTSKITIIVTGASTLVCGAIALVYSLWKLQGVKRQHDKKLGEERVDEDEPGCLGFLWSLAGL
ncbi:hypothetical protein BD779DRAFT_1681574 [Infundibulicybe gibba]|nr:hypothetical protein BD779DRAFT_1681574 [Infundibulicybe gibba]